MMKRRVTSIILLALLLSISIPMLPVQALIEGDSGGTAGISNITPVITIPSLKTAAAVSKNNSAIDVWTEYRISLTLADDNTLEDITTLQFKIWGPSSTEGGADSDVDHYTFVYTQSTDAWDETGPDSGDEHLIVGSCVDPADQTDGSGTFTLGFKIHKTAEYSASTEGWSIKITATDDSAATDTDTTLMFGVNFYLEMTVDDGTHSWSTLSPGDSQQTLDTPVDTDIDMTVTANAAYDLQGKVSAAPTSGSYTIPLSNLVIHEDTVGSAVALTTGYVDIGGLTSEAAGEDNAEVFKLWLTVPNPQMDGSYTYTLYVQGIQA